MSEKLRVRITQEYEVDVERWAAEYGLSGDFDEVVADVRSYLSGADSFSDNQVGDGLVIPAPTSARVEVL